MSSTTTSAKLILRNPDDWIPWLEMVKSTATTGQVWDYVDPSKTVAQLPALTEPTWPQPNDLPLTAEEQAGTLTAAHKEELSELRGLYKLTLNRYDQRKASIANLHRIIQETVHPDRVHHTFNCDSVHQMLVNLQSRLKPKEDVRRLQLTDQYRELQKSPKSKNLDNWLMNWEKVYREGIALTQPIVQQDTAVQDFLRAVFDLTPDFSSFWTNTIQSIDDVSKRPSLYDIIDRFRVQRQILGTSTSKPDSSHSAFSATLQGQSEAKPKSPCVCGKIHRYAQCWYLDNSTAPAGWQENLTVRKKVEEQLQKPEKRTAVERALQRKKKSDSEKSTMLKDDNKAEIQHQGFALSAFATENDDNEFPLHESFILDSGADTHVCNNINRATGPIRLAPPGERLATGNGWIPVIGYGEIEVKAKAPAPRYQQTVKLKDVAFIPTFFTNVISLKKLIKGGIDWLTRQNKLILEDRVFCLVEEKFGQWVLEFNPTSDNRHRNSPATYAIRSNQPRVSKGPATTWHERLAHCGPEVLEHLPTAVTGAKLVDGPTTSECETCGISKAHKIISRKPSPRATIPFDRVHWDIIHFSEGFNGHRYASHFLDDKTRMNWVYTHSAKSQTVLLQIFHEFDAFVKRQFNRKIKIFRIDGETALGKLFDDWGTNEGLEFETSTPYSPEQNGSAERSGGVIVNKSRCIRIRASLPEDMWPETVKAAAYLVNRTPAKHLGWRSPVEILQVSLGYTAIQPDIGHLRVYGCRVYVHIPEEIRRREQYHKLGPRAKIGYLVGYQSTNIYRIWIPQDEEVRPEKDVIFDENTFFDPKELKESIPEEITTMEIPTLSTTLPGGLILEDFENEGVINTLPEIADSREPDSQLPLDNVTLESETIPSSHTAPSLLTPTSMRSPQLPSGTLSSDSSATDQLIPELPHIVTGPSREIRGNVEGSNIIDGPRTRKPSRRKEAYAAALSTSPEEFYAFREAYAVGARHQDPHLHRDQLPRPPRNWYELQRHPEHEGFARAAEKEYKALKEKGTFQVVPKQDGSFIIPLTWVFDYKFDHNGYLVRYKARICVRGDLQPATEQDTYAATVKMKVLRFLLALTAAYDLDTWHADVTNAFLNSELDEIVYCRFPDGFFQTGKCLKLLRALYGLRRAPRLWQQEFTSFLKRLGLRQIEEEPCLFTNNKGIFLLFYVDDILLMSRKDCSQEAFRIRDALLQEYDMKELGELRWFLGIRVIRDRSQCKLWLCQDSYVEKITHKYNLQFRRHPLTPMPTDSLTPHTGRATPQQIHAFQGKTGSINYATTQTRPDVARAASNLAEFSTNPSQQHQDAADQAILYLNGTRYYAIEYSASANNQEIIIPWPEKERVLDIASDAGFGNCSTTRRSSEGYLFKLFGGPIDWSSTKQKTVSTSTTEAELLALSHAATEALWWNRLFEDLRFDLGHEITIYCDNQQTIRLLVKDLPTLMTKLKHVDIRRHWLREQVADEKIKVTWIPTSQMPADGLTKALPRQKHQNFVRQLGLVDLSKLGILGDQDTAKMVNSDDG